MCVCVCVCVCVCAGIVQIFNYTEIPTNRWTLLTVRIHLSVLHCRNVQLKPLEKPKTPALPMEDLIKDFGGLKGQKL